MLIRFRVQNFLSLKEEQELSLVSSSLVENKAVGLISLGTEGESYQLLPVASILGPNASGKTNVISSILFMANLVCSSQNPNGEELIHPCFLLDPDMKEQPSIFEVEVLIEGVRYIYGFSLTSSRIWEEWLFAYPKGRKQEWFTRDFQPESHQYEVKFGANFKSVRKLTRQAIQEQTKEKNLLLTVAAAFNHEKILPLFHWFQQNVRTASERSQKKYFQKIVASIDQNSQLKENILSLLKQADLGIVGLSIHSKLLEKEKYYQLTLHHKGVDEDTHSPLNWEMESSGTKTFFSQLAILLETLNSGSLLLIDEMETSLHPDLFRVLIEFFQNPKINKKQAQLIFNTHDTHLLNSNALRRDQIWLTEKDYRGGTHLYPLTDIKPRKGENLEKGYLQGRYGAIPHLDNFSITLS